MFSKDSVKLQPNYITKKIVEKEVVKALQKEEYTLNAVNRYGENLLHISAANGCLDIAKEILRKQDSCQIIDRKTKFGWTPLMLAIRNRDVKTVEYLLEKNANVNESTYLGMSVFGLAAAINKDMFETVYKACPSALLNSINDDITPLCIAAMKNDKNLFFRLIELGFDISKNNEYTSIMMKQSAIPEIKKLTKHLDIENYWNDTLDNIVVENASNREDHLHFFNFNGIEENYLIGKVDCVQNKHDNSNISLLNVPIVPKFTFDTAESNTDKCHNNIITNSNKCLKSCTLNLMTNKLESAQCNLISPTLSFTLNEILPISPNTISFNIASDAEDKQLIQNQSEIVTTYPKDNKDLTEQPLQRLQHIRPHDLNIKSEEEDLNATLEYVPEFSPLRSPNVPPDINDENVFGESTPTPPRYKTPPRGMILNSEEAKMFVLLKHYGLGQHVPIFLQQEIDIDLFMILTDEDLIQIGIKNEVDRKAILHVIMDYNNSKH
ncbi:Ankyrin-3 [Habropoda laboriosa]|uniref:Ankyrin-3 n=1 Tax=Habropoda laboriosa TaxID=597456 RepID=A0A0L7RE12_9HYME|nr:Ankyrin-3 [Habropoda laboriosa]